jgi:shikimate dehydrogenase
MNFSPKTLINLIIGDPVEHSLSPKLQNYLYQKLDKSEKYVFLASRVNNNFLSQAVAGCRALNVNGLAVTIPHKSEIIPLLDHVDPIAAQIGAVNTVVNRSGLLQGYNTDYLGVLIPLLKAYQKFDYPENEILDFFAGKQISFDWLDFKILPKLQTQPFLKGKKVALIGAGGAARSVCFAVLKSAAELTIFNRTLQKGENLAIEFGKVFSTKIGFESLESLNLLKNFDIIINTASNELSGKQSLINQAHLSGKQIIFDTVYKPGGTELIKLAKGQQNILIYGQQMLFWQGVYQCKLHLGID